MANNVTIGINLDDGGKAEQLRKSLEASKKAASEIRVPNAVMAAREGVAASQPVAAKYRAAAAQPGGGASDTNLSRGITGSTGAGGRDFAAQAQGLGGLVHVYATFAANLYAVSAAFTALSKAMDTSNLIKGLDQIGAVSGKNLGGLAKQLVNVTDGAISLQQAMTSTAMGTSAGMTSSQMLRLTAVAKTASLALGRDLPDSMDRLTKGIIKTQPELLDELGIMTRVIPAQQEYAKQLGKSVDALSTFEKQQAFTNAVLSEGERKFGNIALDTNPYTKVLASISNLMQSGLELINKVLGPIMQALSASPTGLTVTLTALGSLLLKQAIPAIGMYRKAADDLRKESFRNLKQAADDNKARLEAGDLAASQSAERQFQLDNKSRIESLKRFKSNQEIIGSEVKGLTKKSVFDLSSADMKAIQDRANTLLSSDDELYKKQGQKLNNYLAKATKLRQDSDKFAEIEVDKKIAAESGRFAHSTLMEQNLGQSAQQASRRRILALTAETAAVLGTQAAWAVLNAEMKIHGSGGGMVDGVAVPKATGAWEKLKNMWALGAGTAVILGEALATLANTLMSLLGYVGLVVIAFEFLDSWFGSSSKQSSVYNESLDALNSSFDNVGRTLDVINKKPLLEQLSVQSIQAKATAIGELSSAFKDTIYKFEKLEAAQSGWDKFWDETIFGKFGKSSKDKLRNNISETVVDAFKLLDEGPAKLQAKKELESLLGQDVDISSLEGFKNSIKDIDKTLLSSKIGNISSIIERSATASQNGATALTSFVDALKQLNKTGLEMTNSLQLTDIYSKMGQDLEKVFDSFKEVIKNPIEGMQSLNALIKDTQTLSLLPPGTQQILLASRKEIEKINTELAASQAAVKTAAAAESKARVDRDKFNKLNPTYVSQVSMGEDDPVVKQNKLLKLETDRLKIAQERVKAANAAARAEVQKFSFIAPELFKSSIDLMSQGLKKAMQEASISISKTYSDLIKASGGGTANLDAMIAKRQIDLQLLDLNAKWSNTLALESLSLKIEALKLTEDKRLAFDAKDQEAWKMADEALQSVTIAQKLLSDLASGKTTAAELRSGAVNVAGSTTGGGRAGVPVDVQISNKAYGLISKVISESFGRDAAMVGIKSQLKSVELQRKAGKSSESIGQGIKTLQAEGAGIQVGLEQIEALKQYSVTYNDVLTSREAILKIDALENKYQLDKLSLQQKEQGAQVVIDALSTKANKTAEESEALAEARLAITNIITERITLNNKSTSDMNSLENKLFIDRKKGVDQLNKEELDYNKTRKDSYLELKNIQDTIQENNLSYLKEIGAISESEYIRQSDSLKLAAEDRKYQEEKANIVKSAAEEAKKYDPLISRLNLLKDENAAVIMNSEATKEQRDNAIAGNAIIASQLLDIGKINSRNNSIVSDQLVQLDATNESRKQAIELASGLKQVLADQAEEMAKLVSITTNLVVIFGDIGTALGKSFEILKSFNQEDEQYLIKKASLQSQLDKTESKSAEETRLTKALMTLDEKHSQNQLAGIGAILGASKKLFKENEVGYKLLNNLEKANHAMQMFNQAKEIGTVIANFAEKIGLTAAWSAAQAAADAEAAASAAASSAAVGSASVPAVMMKFLESMGPWGWAAGAAAIAALGFASQGGTSVDMTGKTAAERQTAQGTGTVTGDPTAKSQSIDNSLAILNATTVEGLSYSNKMVELLSDIKDGITGVAMNASTVVGLRTGSQFGTQEGSTGWSVLGGLLGSSTSREITDAGLKISGSFASVMENISKSVRTYEDVLTTSSSSFLWMSSTSQSLDQQLGNIDTKLAESLGKVFNNAGNIMIEAGKKLGMTSAQVMKSLATVDVSTLTSLRGLSGKALEDAINSVFSSMLDKAAGTVFQSLQVYNKFGEGMLETTLRVIDGMDKVNLAMDSVGKTNVGTGITGIALSDAMIKASGSLSNFIDQSKTFADKFLTPAERLTPKQVALNKELNKLGYASDLTKAQFKELVLGFKVTDIASATAYGKLIALSSAVDDVANAVNEAANQFTDQDIKIFELLGKTSEATALSRQKELDAMDDALKPRQKYIYALTDEMDLKKQLTDQYKSTTSALESAIKTLKQYKSSLLQGAASTLTPIEKYAQAKALFTQTAAAARANINLTSSKEDIAARDEALGKIQSVSDSLLSVSRDVTGGGQQYAADFAAVTDTVDSLTTQLSGQLTDTQKQLGFLDTIATATKTTAEILSSYYSAKATSDSAAVAAGLPITPHAMGGLATGLSLVGEQGPEIVDFKNPGRVYSNRASNDLFNNQELIAEIKSLKEEVSQLRADQNRQTGDIIQTNYDANRQNAEALAEAQLAAVNQQNWKTRSMVKVA